MATITIGPGITLGPGITFVPMGPASITDDPYFQYVTLLLSGGGTDGARNNTFTDSSTNNFSITRAGNTTQGTFSPYGDNWSNYFDGSGDYLTYSSPANTVRDWWVGDYTCEAWIYPTTLGNWSNNASGIRPNVIGNMTPDNDTTYWAFGINGANGELRFYYFNGAAVQIASGLYVNANQWNHIAFTKTSSGITFFCNGVKSASTTAVSGTPQSSSATPITIGSARGTAAAGYISNLRTIYGTALYSGATYTVPTTPLTAVAGTSLLTCQSNRFRDSSSNNFTITRSGTPSVQRWSPFSPSAAYSTSTIGGSGYFGSGNYVSAASNAAFAPGTGDFTIEAWVNPTSAYTTYNYILGVAVTNGLVFYVTGGNLVVRAYNTGDLLSSSTIPALNTWTHVAATRSGTTLRIFVNGVQTASTTNSTNFVQGAAYVGNDGANLAPWYGYIADLRLVKGTAVYTSSFTPPAAPLTAIANTSLLLNMTNAGISDNAMMNNLETVGNAQISTSVKKFGTGSLAFDGSGDYLVIPYGISSLDFGSGNYTIEFWLYAQATTASSTVIAKGNPGSIGADYISIEFQGNQLQHYVGAYSVAAPICAASGITWTNIWHHVAVVRNGNTWTMYVDGVAQSTTTTGSYTITATSSPNPSYIGTSSYSTGRTFTGYIDDLRITRGYARYTSNFTPPGELS
jgi:hypothetical protein